MFYFVTFNYEFPQYQRLQFQFNIFHKIKLYTKNIIMF